MYVDINNKINLSEHCIIITIMLYAHSQWLHEHVADELREYLHGIITVATRIKLTLSCSYVYGRTMTPEM